ncbi:MAG: AI-2E family transporter [Evtepia gabavorous]
MLALAFSLYLLAQKETLTGQAKEGGPGSLSEKWAHWITDVARMTNRTFSNFVTGQTHRGGYSGHLLCFLGMLIFRLPYAGVISVLVGFTALIPIFGAFIGVGIGAFLILLVSPIKALWFILFFVILQQLEGNLIYPGWWASPWGCPGSGSWPR